MKYHNVQLMQLSIIKHKYANVLLIVLIQTEFNVSLAIFLTSGTKPPNSATLVIADWFTTQNPNNVRSVQQKHLSKLTINVIHAQRTLIMTTVSSAVSSVSKDLTTMKPRRNAWKMLCHVNTKKSTTRITRNVFVLMTNHSTLASSVSPALNPTTGTTLLLNANTVQQGCSTMFPQRLVKSVLKKLLSKSTGSVMLVPRIPSTTKRRTCVCNVQKAALTTVKPRAVNSTKSQSSSTFPASETKSTTNLVECVNVLPLSHTSLASNVSIVKPQLSGVKSTRSVINAMMDFSTTLHPKHASNVLLKLPSRRTESVSLVPKALTTT